MSKVTDSAYVVNGRYFANLFDAERQRQLAVEKEAREAARGQQYEARQARSA